MKKPLIVKCVLLSFVVFSFILFTSFLYANKDQNAVENIIRRAYTAIAQIEEGKIFFNPEKLYVKQGVTYVEDIDGAGFAIPISFSSEGRPYMQVSESIIFNSWICGCGAWNHKWDYPTHCWSCHNPR